MRFQEYLTEAETDGAKCRKSALEYFKKVGWKLPKDVLKNTPKVKPILFRGYRNDVDVYTASPRQDRMPRDTDSRVHEILDNYFLKKFGWKARSEGLFVSPNPATGKAYANSATWHRTYMIFPNGSFEYIWSPTVRDLYDTVANFGTTAATKEHKRFIKYLDEFEYTNKNLEKNEKNEVMIKCSSYTAINMYYYPFYLSKYRLKPTDQWIITLIREEIDSRA